MRSVPPADLLLETALLPDDFPRRLERFKEALGVSWDVLAACLGVDPRQLQRWRHGTRPCGDSVFALFQLADRVPGSERLLLGEMPARLRPLDPVERHRRR